MTPQDTMRLAQTLREAAFGGHSYSLLLLRAADEIEALRSALSQQVEQPVAWYDEEIDCAYTEKELDGGTSEGLTPLYAGAAPAAQPMCKKHPRYSTYPLCPDCCYEEEAQRRAAPAIMETYIKDHKTQPLTDEQIDSASPAAQIVNKAAFREFARWVEMQHGIGVQK